MQKSKQMLVINDNDIESIGIHWNKVIGVIKSSVCIMGQNDYSQPLKPYLRYGDAANRIIAMPAYIGGCISLSGIKWIASFPGNAAKGLPRAHSVTVLNEADTGLPLCVFNSALISGIRTAGVSGLVVTEWMKKRKEQQEFTVGIIGLGPIGRLHLEMIRALLGPRISKILLYDIKGIDAGSLPEEVRNYTTVCSSWEEILPEADIFITCTVSKQTYVDLAPRKGSLQLNISLRDYKPEFFKYVDTIIVDDWTEVCREKTDIDIMNKMHGLTVEQTHSIVDLINDDVLARGGESDVVMFNPMGMAVFDIAVAGHYYTEVLKARVNKCHV